MGQAVAVSDFRPGVSAAQTCSRCIMDTSDPEIRFDEDGVCGHCHHFEMRVRTELVPIRSQPDSLERLVARIKAAGRGRDYDCVCGVSGGVDSTMVLYHAHRLGLRMLAVHLDNGWNSELAVSNIERVLKMLKIDLVTHVIDWDEFRDLQLAFLKASVANAEIPTDHAIVGLLYRHAAANHIRYILGGGNLATEGIMPRSWMYDAKDLRHIIAIHRRFGRAPLRTYPRFTLAHFFYWTFVKQIRMIPLLNYTQYNKQDALVLLSREFGWRKYDRKHHESIYTRFFQDYILPTKFGIDKRRAHLSSLVVSGQMTRAEALAEMSRDLYTAAQLREDREYVIKKLGQTDSEFDGIMQLPPRNHTDYPSNAWILRGMPQAVDFVKRVATERAEFGVAAKR